MTSMNETLQEPAAGKRRGWRSGLALYAGAQAATFGLTWLAKRTFGEETSPRVPVGGADDKAAYNALRQPVFAPPDWVFAPVWTLNSTLQIWGLLHVLNLPPETPGRAAFLRWQAAFWATYVAFTPIFFGLRSPILGSAITIASLATVTASAGVAAGELRDRKALLSLATVWPWLVVASATSAAIALWNRDELLDVGPIADPPPGWEKTPEPA
jgi:tryptophan-rich sensory protein